MIFLILVIIFFVLLFSISGSSKRQRDLLVQQKNIMERDANKIELEKAKRRDCPECGESITRAAIKCRFCSASVTPKYVDDVAANNQILKILSLKSDGKSPHEIAEELNSNGDLFLADMSRWDYEKVNTVISSFG